MSKSPSNHQGSSQETPDLEQLDKDFNAIQHTLSQMSASHVWVLLCTCIVRYCQANQIHLLSLIAALRDLWVMLEQHEKDNKTAPKQKQDKVVH